MAGNDKRRARAWGEAREAARAVPGWMAWRWLFAQEYNAHEPQSAGQREDKVSAGRVAAALVEAMGGALMAPPPVGLSDDPAWAAWLEAATGLEADQRRSLMEVLLHAHLAEHPVPRAEALALARQAWRLSGILLVLAAQERARGAGWQPGGARRSERPRKARGKR